MATTPKDGLVAGAWLVGAAAASRGRAREAMKVFMLNQRVEKWVGLERMVRGERKIEGREKGFRGRREKRAGRR